MKLISRNGLLILFIILLSSMAHAISHAAFSDTFGDNIPLSKLKGKWVIINYWADWCDGCIAEVPELNSFYLHNKDKNILIYGVNYDQLPVDSLKISIQKIGISFPVLTEDPNSVWGLGAINMLPVTFIINPEGKIAKTIVGPSTEQSIKQILYELQA